MVHPALVVSFNDIAVALEDQGCDREAKALYRRALAILEQTVEPIHADVSGR